jgi:hypothetical protein
MAIMTLACSRSDVYGTPHPCNSKVCECDCHKDVEALRQEARARRDQARQLSLEAVKNFQDDMDLITTQAAILALTQYEHTLKEARHGR